MSEQDLALEAKALKLTVDSEGCVWSLHGDGVPTNSKQTAKEFLKTWMLEATETVRVAGTPQNAKLILDLFELRLRGVIESLKVCSPLCCENSDERKDSAALLIDMRKFFRPPSLGGFHEFTLKDLPSYLLADHFLTNDECNDDILIHLKAHPMFPALSFLGALDLAAVARLVAVVVDPRWYIDLNDPDRSSRYEQFLGLNPSTCAQATHAGANWRNNRFRLVSDCWKPQLACKATDKVLDPRLFLWRSWQSKGGGIHGDLSANKMFAHFLRAIWTQAVYEGPLAERLFVAKHFFHNNDEVEAFNQHIADWKKKKGDDSAPDMA